MRYAVVIAMVASALLGCENGQKGQSTEVTVPARPSGELEAVSPPTTEQPERSPLTGVREAESPHSMPPPPETTTPASARRPASQPAPQRTYVVKAGDTLWSIARRVYGDGQKWKDIVAANPGLKAEAMRVGQEIVLPPADE